MNASAIDTFITSHANIEKLLARLQEKHNNHYDANPEDMTWGEVTEIKAVEEQLQNIVDMLFQEGEYTE